MYWFAGWRALAQTALAGVIAYSALVLFLRVSGKRTLSKMNAFDFVVTIALGSALAAVFTSQGLPLANGLLALLLLIFLQYLVAWLGSRAPWFRRLISAEPSLLFSRGEFLDGALSRARMSREEVIAAVRKDGIGDLADVAAVIIETDGTLSVVRTTAHPTRHTTLRNVQGTG